MGRAKNPTSFMNVAEQQNTVLAKRLSGLITDVSELKDYLGVSPQAINQYRLGVARPSLENLCKIADFYKVSTDYLLGRTETKTMQEDIAVAVKTTGLSENAIKKLKGNRTCGEIAQRKELSRLITNEKFWEVVVSMCHYRQSCEINEKYLNLLRKDNEGYDSWKRRAFGGRISPMEEKYDYRMPRTSEIVEYEAKEYESESEKELALFRAQKQLFAIAQEIEAEVKENAVDPKEGE